MKVMILAAGRGERMRPLTDTLPKPMLPCGREPLIGWHLRRLADAGLCDIVINHAWLGHEIEAGLGDGSRYGVRIAYSPEGGQGLETAGGIATALPLLGDAPFLVINGDVLTDLDFRAMRAKAALPAGCLAYLWLVPNPAHNPQGDFFLHADGRVGSEADADAEALTFSGAGIYHPALFAATPPRQAAKLAPLLREAMRQGQVRGERHGGLWLDVGTPDRLQQAAAITAAW
ncbi:MAG: nucleotidyltransferase family protein [Eikenella sp.]|nr:nucleotidyltransferase family protein [Eikenella sp.]